MDAVMRLPFQPVGGVSASASNRSIAAAQGVVGPPTISRTWLASRLAPP